MELYHLEVKQSQNSVIIFTLIIILSNLLLFYTPLYIIKLYQKMRI